MNTRIQNILDQAINAMPEHLDFDIPKELAEKFAELIVKECMTVCENFAERNDPTVSCYYDLKEHFGVTE